MKESIKKIYHKLLNFFPKKMAHKILYYSVTKKKLNLDNPKDINEKIQWLILNEYGTKEAKLTDKYLVREYVKEKGYERILPKLIGVYSDVKEIDFEKLPSKFVLKTNNGSGDIFLCYDKQNFNIELCKKTLKKNMKKDFSKEMQEYHYSLIEPKIVAEEYLEEDGMKNPLDYKIYCFNGKAECILLCSEREKKVRIDNYDLNWNYLDYSLPVYRSKNQYKKPEKLDEMIRIAEDLSRRNKICKNGPVLCK